MTAALDRAGFEKAAATSLTAGVAAVYIGVAP
jgi:hypothetical protein